MSTVGRRQDSHATEHRRRHAHRTPISRSTSSASSSRRPSPAPTRWARAIATSPTRWPSRRCAARWTRCRSTARSSSAKASATRRRCSTSARRSAWRRKATAAARYPRGRHRRRSARRHEPVRDRRAERDRGARGVGEAAACCTRPTSTWRSWSSARARSDVVDLDAPVRDNLRAIAQALGRQVEDLVVIVLDRPRHEKLIADIRATGARIRLIGDGDLSAGIAAAVVGTGVHAVMGTGGAPEGVLTAAAMRCLNGEIFARLVVSKPEHEERCRAMGITDFKKIYRSKDLASGQEHRLRRDRRHRRHADEGRAVLRRRHPHQLADHADAPASHPLHRQHPRADTDGRSARSASDGSEVPSVRRTSSSDRARRGAAISRRHRRRRSSASPASRW